MNRTEEIRKTLREFVLYDKGELLRRELKDIADKTYIQKYSDKEQIDFLDRNEVSIRKLHPQSTNFPYYLEMFTVSTQRVYADNIRQIIDKGIDNERNRS